MRAAHGVLAEVHALAPSFAARAAETEAARRLPPDIARSLAQAGVFRLLVPESIGGIEAPPHLVFDVFETLAEADAAVGWCAGIGATSGLPAAYLPEAEARTIYGDPLAITGGVYAPTGRAVKEADGYRLNGRWKWASGSQNCGWLMGGALLMENGKPIMDAQGVPEMLMLFFPAASAVLHDTWHVSGLCGTGSLDIEVRDLLIPFGRAVSLSADKPVRGGATYAFPAFGLLSLTIAAVALGIAKGALGDVRLLAGARVPTGSRRPMAERPAVQAAFAEATAKLSAARSFFRSEVTRAEAAAEGDGTLDTELRASLRLAATYATRTAAQVVDACYDLGGGSSVFNESPLQRRFRDVHAATQHMMIAPQTYELAGRVLFGLPTDATTL